MCIGFQTHLRGCPTSCRDTPNLGVNGLYRLSSKLEGTRKRYGLLMVAAKRPRRLHKRPRGLNLGGAFLWLLPNGRAGCSNVAVLFFLGALPNASATGYGVMGAGFVGPSGGVNQIYGKVFHTASGYGLRLHGLSSVILLKLACNSALGQTPWVSNVVVPRFPFKLMGYTAARGADAVARCPFNSCTVNTYGLGIGPLSYGASNASLGSHVACSSDLRLVKLTVSIAARRVDAIVLCPL